MRRRLSTTVSLLAAALACAGCGYLPSLGDGPAKPAVDVRALASDPALTAARIAALEKALAGRPGEGCNSVDGTELESVDYPPDRLRATLSAGGVDRIWLERHRPPCAGPRVNLMAGFRPQPFATPLLPGETLADPGMQADLRPPVRAAVEALIGPRPAGCGAGGTAAAEGQVVDTRIASPPETRAATTTWRERWTVALCSQRRTVDVVYTSREADGATTFRVVPSPAGAAGRG